MSLHLNFWVSFLRVCTALCVSFLQPLPPPYFLFQNKNKTDKEEKWYLFVSYLSFKFIFTFYLKLFSLSGILKKKIKFHFYIGYLSIKENKQTKTTKIFIVRFYFIFLEKLLCYWLMWHVGPIMFPIYGRRYCSVRLRVLNDALSNSCGLRGLRFRHTWSKQHLVRSFFKKYLLLLVYGPNRVSPSFSTSFLYQQQFPKSNSTSTQKVAHNFVKCSLPCERGKIYHLQFSWRK